MYMLIVETIGKFLAKYEIDISYTERTVQIQDSITQYDFEDSTKSSNYSCGLAILLISEKSFWKLETFYFGNRINFFDETVFGNTVRFEFVKNPL